MGVGVDVLAPTFVVAAGHPPGSLGRIAGQEKNAERERERESEDNKREARKSVSGHGFYKS